MKICCLSWAAALVLGAALSGCGSSITAAPAQPGAQDLCGWPRACYLNDGTCSRVMRDSKGATLIVRQDREPLNSEAAYICGSFGLTNVVCAQLSEVCPALGPACDTACARNGQAQSGGTCGAAYAAPVSTAAGPRCRYADDVCCLPAADMSLPTDGGARDATTGG